MKRNDNKLIFVQMIVLLGIIGYLVIDSGVLGTRLGNGRETTASGGTPVKRELESDGDVAALMKFSEDIRKNLQVIDGEVESRRRELGNVRKILNHYRNSVRENHETLSSLRREIQKLARLRKNVKSQIERESGKRARVSPVARNGSSSTLRSNFENFAVQDRRWRGRTVLAIPTGLQIDERTEDLDSAALARFQPILDRIRDAGVSEVLIARPWVGESDSFSTGFRSRMAELFGPGVETKFVNTDSIIEKPQLEELEIWLPVSAARAKTEVGSL